MLLSFLTQLVKEATTKLLLKPPRMLRVRFFSPPQELRMEYKKNLLGSLESLKLIYQLSGLSTPEKKNKSINSTSLDQ
jgi:hypothetical protein